jgi:ribosomal protein S18 acetylase RimI-like enzyme
MITIQLCKFQDLGRVTNFEAATQEFPLNQEEMKKLFQDQNQDAYAAYVGKRMVGHTLVTFHKPQGFTLITSIGVHPHFRRVGVATKMVGKIAAVSFSDGLSHLRIEVPSYLVEDKDDPWNIEHWLWRLQFKAIKTRTDACNYYGRDYDLYVFERRVG